MSEASLSTSVNHHYLDKVMELTDVMDVAASEDIYDMRGMKLVAKGARVTRAQQGTLGLHKLKKSLESSLIAEDAADANLIVSCAAKVMQSSAPLGRILATVRGAGASPLAILSNMKFGHAMRMMLTLTDRLGAHALEHSVTVSLLSILMAKKLHLSDDQQMAAGLAGLLHDIGELYIDPIYLMPGKRLLPHEWAHLVVHPRIGQLLIADLESYPSAVGRAVAEHHERCDGTGYPRQVAGVQISPVGQAVSVAEMIAGVLSKDAPLERAELALKIVPGEHAHQLLSAVSGALRSQGTRDVANLAMHGDEDNVGRLFDRIARALHSARELAGAPMLAPRSRELVNRAIDRARTIERAFISTGLDAFLNDDHRLHDAGQDVYFEKAVATREIEWRLRDIARDLALHAAHLPGELPKLAGLIALLDGQAPEAVDDAPAMPLMARGVQMAGAFVA